MTRRSTRFAVALAATGLILTACGGGDDDATDATTAGTEAAADGTEAPDTTAASDDTATDDTAADDTATTTATEDTAASDTTEGGASAGSGWTVNTDDCVDPDAANAAIEGPISIASVMPLSNSPAAAAFAPVAEGFQAYIDYANEKGLLPDHELTLSVGDDSYDPSKTLNVVNGQLDSGAQLFSGIIGTPNNQAVQQTLNEECVPQILALTGAPEWGNVAEFPWTTGGLIPYDIESKAYVADMQTVLPDGGSIAFFYVNSEFGQVYKDSFEGVAKDAGYEIVDTQTVEAADSSPPTAQVSSIASKKPDVIMAVPLGAGCPAFLKELQNAKAANAGWEPRVYLTNTCASQLIIGLAGDAANGLYTSASAGLEDIQNPAVQTANPKVAEYVAYMTARGKADMATTAAAGWNTGELTVEILRQAAESPEGLTQASIMNASRSLDYVPSLVREGVEYTMDGENDVFYAEDVQVIQYDATAKIFNDVGELNTSFRSS